MYKIATFDISNKTWHERGLNNQSFIARKHIAELLYSMKSDKSFFINRNKYANRYCIDYIYIEHIK